MADPKAIKAALRRRTEAKAAQKAYLARLAEPGCEMAFDDMTPEDPFALLKQRGREMHLCDQLEGFVLGWLAAMGKFDDYRELAEIWLDTPKRSQAAVGSHSEIADPLERFNARLNLPRSRGKRSRS